MTEPRGERFIFGLRELNGALGDVGTLLPLMLGAVAVAGLAPLPVLLGFAVFYVASAFCYRLPVPVQPMKAIAAVLLTTGMTAADVAVSGVMVGIVLLILGVSGWITRIARLVPQSVLAGLQLGLGLALALMSVDLIATAPLIGTVTLALVVGLLFVPRLPSALFGLGMAVLLAQFLDVQSTRVDVSSTAAFLIPALPALPDLERIVSASVLPQLSLTVTNAILLTALIAGDYFGDRAAHVTPARLSITSGLANILLTPFGAFPMCHGAGGLVAHYRFGARSGTAPLALGLVLLAVVLLPDRYGLAMLGAIPAAGLGALLLVAAGDLALSRRLFDSRPSCWPVIAVTAGLTLWVDPFWGLLAGFASELLRSAAIRLWRLKVARQDSGR